MTNVVAGLEQVCILIRIIQLSKRLNSIVGNNEVSRAKKEVENPHVLRYAVWYASPMVSKSECKPKQDTYRLLH